LEGLTVPRGRTRFTHRDVTRLVRAAEAVGKEVTSIRVEKDGTLVAAIREPGKAEVPAGIAVTPLEAWKAKKNADPA
jgi:hypothetical protein